MSEEQSFVWTVIQVAVGGLIGGSVGFAVVPIVVSLLIEQ